jgi:hypothetical protein
MSKTTDSLNCVFCLKKGILGPHNHMVRNTNIKGNPIVCPELLSTECNYCHVKGHTPKYCPVLQLKNNKKNKNKNNNKVEYKDCNVNKRSILPISDTDLLSNKIRKTDNMVAWLGALNMDTNISE